MNDQELILAAIKASGLSAVRYAQDVLIRDPRTIRRWIAGGAPIPQQVRSFLEHQLLPKPETET